MYVTFGSEVARTPAPSVICGIGVLRSVAATVGRAVGEGDADARATVADARAVGVAVGATVGVGGIVGASVRNGSVAAGVGSGSTAVSLLSAIGGWSGAFGFFGCASA